MNDLTNKQIQFLLDIIAYIREENRPPTNREMQELGGFKSPRSVGQYLEVLEKAGYVERGNGSRNIKIIKNPPISQSDSGKTVQVPIVGCAPCGVPFLAEQNIEGSLSISVKIARPPHRYFILKVKGDSMDKANIKDGEMVLVRQQITADDGEDVVALIDDEATIKRLRHFNGYVALEPVSSNQKNQRIILEKNFMIQGVVVATIPNM